MSEEKRREPWERWLEEAAKRNAEAMKECRVYLGLFTGDWQEEALPLLQLGIAMVLDKPLLLVVPPGVPLSENLRKVAAGLLEIDLRASGSQEAIAVWVKEKIEDCQ